jgi:hypothetical protein
MTLEHEWPWAKRFTRQAGEKDPQRAKKKKKKIRGSDMTLAQSEQEGTDENYKNQTETCP